MGHTMKQTKKQTSHIYRVTVTGYVNDIVFEKVNRTTAERARKYALSVCRSFGYEPDSVVVEYVGVPILVSA